MIGEYGIRYSAKPPVCGPRRTLRQAVRALLPEVFWTAGGLGWVPVLLALYLTVVLTMMRGAFDEGDEARSSAAAAAVRDFLFATQRILLAANGFVTPSWFS